MKFKLNTIENFKKKGITLSKEIFDKALKEFYETKVVNKRAIGKFYKNAEDLINDKLFFDMRESSHIVEEINFDTYECEVRILDLPHNTLKSVIDIIDLELQTRGAGTISNNKEVGEDWKISHLSFVPKNLEV